MSPSYDDWQGARTAAAAGFKGPFKGLDETDGNRLCQPPGKSATCKGATADGKCHIFQGALP